MELFKAIYFIDVETTSRPSVMQTSGVTRQPRARRLFIDEGAGEQEEDEEQKQPADA